jgi:hypothetical protein
METHMERPIDRDLELAVIDEEREHMLVSPCRRAFGAWIDIKTNQRLVLDPTHCQIEQIS